MNEFIENIEQKSEEKFFLLKEKGIGNIHLEEIKKTMMKQEFNNLRKESANYIEEVKISIDFIKEREEDLFKVLLKEVENNRLIDTMDLSETDERSNNSNVEIWDNIEINDSLIKELHEKALHSFHDNKIKEAYHISTVLCSLDADNPKYHYLRAVALMNEGKLEKAIRNLCVIIHIHPEYEYAYLSLMECLIMNDDAKKAKEIYSEMETFLFSNRDAFENPHFFEEQMQKIENLLKKPQKDSI